MAVDTRSSYHRTLEEIDRKVTQLLFLLSDSLAAAADALLAGDAAAAAQLTERDRAIDALRYDVETLVQHQFACQQPVAGDFRFLISVLRIVPELERSHDLAEHIAQYGRPGYGSELTPRIRGILDAMARCGVDMWRAVADAYIDRDANAASRLTDQDDELDRLRAELTRDLEAGAVPVSLAVEMTLVGRFFERLGDHAVNVARRVRYMAIGRE